jgi:iron(III) transport system permease protein
MRRTSRQASRQRTLVLVPIGRARTAGKLLFALVLFVMYGLPAVMLIAGAFRTAAPGAHGGWSAHAFAQAYTTAATYMTLRNSLLYAGSVALVATALGAFFACVSARTNAPGRRLLTPMMVTCLMLPPLYYGFGWINLGNKQNGILNAWFHDLTGSSASPINVISWPGLIFITCVGLTPVAYLVLLGPFRNLDRSLEEASRMAGAGGLRTATRVTLPVLAPALMGTAALVLILGLQAFEIPQLIGRPADIRVFSTQIYGYIYDKTPSQYAQAASLALLLIVIVSLLFVGQLLLMRRRSYATVTGKGFRPEPTRLGGVRWVLTAAIAVFGICNPLLPLGSVMLGSFQPVFGVLGHLTLANYRAAWTDPDSISALQTTAWMALIGGFVAVVLVFCTAYIGLRGKGLIRPYAQGITWIPWAMPGIVLSLGFLWTYSAIPGLKLLYGTVILMMIALIVEVSPLIGRVADGALAQLSADLEEAARTSGASAARMFAGIVLRLVLPSFVAGWFLAALQMSGDLAVPVLLSSITTRPVSVTAYAMYNNGDTAAAAALSCTILFAVVGILLVAQTARVVIRWIRGKRQVRDVVSSRPTHHLKVTTDY